METHSSPRKILIGSSTAFGPAGLKAKPAGRSAKVVTPTPAPPAAPVPRTSCPTKWFRDPLDKAIKKLVRPSTAERRRKFLVIKHALPLQVFEDFLSPLQAIDVEGLRRAPDNSLIPTSQTSTLRKYTYILKKGSVIDKLFRLQELDPEPPTPEPEPEVEQIGESNVYEVEQIVRSRKKGKRTEYEIKWRGWASETNTWEAASRIHPALVAAFEGKPAPLPRISKPLLPRRGAGAARARLSCAEQRRGGVPQTISMVCGNVVVELKESVKQERMPTLTLTFLVLSMDKTGHIIWPTNFNPRTRAALRLQARALLQRMIDDPLNPVDSSMAPALTATGTSAVWKGAPQRELVVVQPQMA